MYGIYINEPESFDDLSGEPHIDNECDITARITYNKDGVATKLENYMQGRSTNELIHRTYEYNGPKENPTYALRVYEINYVKRSLDPISGGVKTKVEESCENSYVRALGKTRNIVERILQERGLRAYHITAE